MWRVRDNPVLGFLSRGEWRRRGATAVCWSGTGTVSSLGCCGGAASVSVCPCSVSVSSAVPSGSNCLIRMGPHFAIVAAVAALDAIAWAFFELCCVLPFTVLRLENLVLYICRRNLR
jgi:hypothetical protein